MREPVSGQSVATTEPERVVVPKAKERQWVDAPEPGTYLDPFTGQLKQCRPRRRWWREAPGEDR